MKKNLITTLVFVFISALFVSTAAAQFPIKIPKISKPKSEKPTPNDPTETPTGKTSPAKSVQSKKIYEYEKPPTVPKLLKSSIYIQAKVDKQYWKTPKLNVSSWVPTIEFSVYVDRDTEGFEYTAEYLNPDGTLWFVEPLRTGSYAADRTIKLSSEYLTTRAMLNTKSTNLTGIYGVKINDKSRGKTIFEGKFKVGKFQSEFQKGKSEFDFFVEHDWMMPIGFVGFHHSALTADYGGFGVIASLWMKGEIDSNELEAKVFFAGKQIASTKDTGSLGGVNGYVERQSAQGVFVKNQYFWKLWNFEFFNLRIANGDDFHRTSYPNATYADENPGEYIVKIFHKNIEIRELKFTVGSDGRMVDNFSSQVFIPNYSIIVPVKILPTTEKWVQTAWKTEAFFGSPLSGFVAP